MDQRRRPAYFILFILLFLGSTQAYAQSNIDSTQLGLFDFWVGEWNLTWETLDGSTGHGNNRVQKILDGTVIYENFEATDAGKMTGYKGKSFTVYNPQSGTWKQTWVDNERAYLEFTGHIEGDKRIFRRSFKNNSGDRIIQRMVFYDIKQNSFTWDWERSSDGGNHWELMWRIHYKRAEQKQK